jgi:hypothetical protein
VSLSPPEHIRRILAEIDFILSQLPGQDYASFSQWEVASTKLGMLRSQLHSLLDRTAQGQQGREGDA